MNRALKTFSTLLRAALVWGAVGACVAAQATALTQKEKEAFLGSATQGCLDQVNASTVMSREEKVAAARVCVCRAGVTINTATREEMMQATKGVTPPSLGAKIRQAEAQCQIRPAAAAASAPPTPPAKAR